MDACIFCKIVKGEIHSHKIWEDEKHLAFLTIFPNTIGVSVVITKEHHSSYAFNASDEILSGLVLASKKVGLLIDSKFPDVGRTAMVFEGFGVDHLHSKLFPMHGTAKEGWTRIPSNVDKFFDNYEGYISTHDYKHADNEWLAEIAKQITE
ncbi:MAG: HIT family protein [Candidatus Pacebacteria bacterium]|nr:HIT family protein [Candidatus Paceibacterota bacterium]